MFSAAALSGEAKQRMRPFGGLGILQRLFLAFLFLDAICGMAQSAASPRITDQSVYHVREWCSVPGKLDDTCFSNAIADVVAHGTPYFSRHHYAELLVSPESYTFYHTVVLPPGINIGIHGAEESGVYGSTISTGLLSGGSSGSVNAFLVLSDNADFRYLSFVQTSDVKREAILLGSPSSGTYDTRINYCWFAGQRIAIHAVNVSGLDLSHNTFDSGTDYGIFSDAKHGDQQAKDILASDLRGYGNLSAISITGDGSDRFSNLAFSGLFDHSIGSQAAVALDHVQDARVDGMWDANKTDDITLKNVTAVNIGQFLASSTGGSFLHVEDSTAVSLFDGSLLNSGGNNITNASIEIIRSRGTRIHDVATTSNSARSGTGPLYGLSIDAQSKDSVLYGNSFQDHHSGEVQLLSSSVSELPLENIRAKSPMHTELQQQRFPISCAGKALQPCTASLAQWNAPFADVNYTAVCTLEATEGMAFVVSVAKQPSGIILTIANGTSTPSKATANCLAVHD